MLGLQTWVLIPAEQPLSFTEPPPQFLPYFFNTHFWVSVLSLVLCCPSDYICKTHLQLPPKLCTIIQPAQVVKLKNILNVSLQLILQLTSPQWSSNRVFSSPIITNYFPGVRWIPITQYQVLKWVLYGEHLESKEQGAKRSSRESLDAILHIAQPGFWRESASTSLHLCTLCSSFLFPLPLS